MMIDSMPSQWSLPLSFSSSLVSSPLSTCSSSCKSNTSDSVQGTSMMDREWSLATCSSSLNDESMFSISKVTFLISSRTDDPIDFLPEKLYSSLKYRFNVEVVLEPSANNESSSLLPHMLLADIDMINTTTGEVVSSSNMKKDVLKGETHLSLQVSTGSRGTKRKPIVAKRKQCSVTDGHNHGKVKQDTNDSVQPRTFTSQTKFQFKDVAYHHQKENVSLRVSLYTLEGYSEQDPLAIMVSAPFQIYGRRTTEQREEETIRKRQYIEQKERLFDPNNILYEPSCKKQKQDEQTAMAQYESALHDLLQTLKGLPLEEQQQAIALAYQTLCINEPTCFNSTIPEDPFQDACECFYWIMPEGEICPNCGNNPTLQRSDSSSCGVLTEDLFSEAPCDMNFDFNFLSEQPELDSPAEDPSLFTSVDETVDSPLFF